MQCGVVLLEGEAMLMKYMSQVNLPTIAQDSLILYWKVVHECVHVLLYSYYLSLLFTHPVVVDC